MAQIDQTYQNLLEKIQVLGYYYEDPNRKGVNRLEVTTDYFEHNFTMGFPALTLKKLAWDKVVAELLWFMRGGDSVIQLHKDNVSIWDQDAYNLYIKRCKALKLVPINFENWKQQLHKPAYEAKALTDGYTGPIYGVQWRAFSGVVDQLKVVVDTLKKNPMSTQMIVSAWNPTYLGDMALPPCHYEFQVVARPLHLVQRMGITGKTTITKSEELDDLGIPTHGIEIIWSQRSTDVFLGLPFNIASYALLCKILALLTGTHALGIKGNLKNVHLYGNSMEEAQNLLELDAWKYKDSDLKINEDLVGITELDDFLNLAKVSDFTLPKYQSYPPVKVDMLARDEGH